MKKKLFLFPFMIIAVIAIMLVNCKQENTKDKVSNMQEEDEKGELTITSMNASQFGIVYPETFVLMQNRMGMRIEYCVDRSDLQLWISPQAFKSLDYYDRNFSNRDDHCNVFDDIKFSHQSFGDFESCDYDAFHSVLNYKNQKVHMLNLFDKPAIVLWFEKEGGVIDFATHNEDKPLKRSAKEFVVEHYERGRTFDYAAIIGKGKGEFRQQLVMDKGRSIYARANLAPGQPLVIAAELKKEKIAELARELAGKDMKSLINENEVKIKEAVKNGKFTLKGKPEMQKLLDINRRIAISMQDGGFMRSTNQYIYYLMWFRDGGMNTSHICYSGWPSVAGEHSKIAILNPNVSNEEPEGIYYGQLMSGPLTKWEEDGLYFVVWPAFSYWTQTGDDSYIKGQYLENMEKGLSWLEDYIYDEEKGLLGRYHYCETPLYGSRGHGWDNAVGRPTDYFASVFEGDTIVRSYDIYMNMLTYSTYLMMSAMEQENGKMDKADEYYQKALALEEKMNKWFEKDSHLPPYGDLITKKGKTVEARPYGMDVTDYRWALSIPVFEPTQPQKYKTFRDQLWKDMTSEPKGIFICAYNAILTSMDPLIHNEDSMMAALDYLVPQSVRAGKYLAMPYTIPELIDEEDGDPFHDVRPLVYSIAPWLSAVTNFGMHRLPFGIAVRANKYINDLENYKYKGALIDARYKGQGRISRIMLNGKELTGTFQIPDNRLKEGDNILIVDMAEDPAKENILAKSTVLLNDVKAEKGQTIYNITAYGKNVLTFMNLSKGVQVTDEAGKAVNTETKQMDNLKYIDFEGRGDYLVVLK